MIPCPFEYYAPATVAEAIALLERFGDEARILAGGHSLLPAMKLRLATPAVLIDITRIAELRGIAVEGMARIGATATWAEIERHAELRRAVPALPEAVELIGDPQVRNRGTLGGSLAHADPAADAPALILALDARIEARGPAGGRSIPADAFFTDMLTTALAPSEVLTAVVIPPLGAGEGAAYVKYRHPASGYAIVGAAAYVRLAGGQVSACRVAVTGAGPVPTRRSAVEQAMLGSDGAAEAIAAAAARAGEDMEVLGDLHAGEEYRRAMVAVYTRRALTAAVERARKAI